MTETNFLFCHSAAQIKERETEPDPTIKRLMSLLNFMRLQHLSCHRRAGRIQKTEKLIDDKPQQRRNKKEEFQIEIQYKMVSLRD